MDGAHQPGIAQPVPGTSNAGLWGCGPHAWPLAQHDTICLSPTRWPRQGGYDWDGIMIITFHKMVLIHMVINLCILVVIHMNVNYLSQNGNQCH